MLTLVFIALALAADAFAAAIATGASVRPRISPFGALCVGLAFGLAQALMTLLGWATGTAFAQVIRGVDHWLALVLLAFIGARMMREGLNKETADISRSLSKRGVAVAALATSVDAAAAGVTFAFMDHSIIWAGALIGGITFVLSCAGVLMGSALGTVVGKRAEVVGGVVLIILGVRIFVEHQFLGG